MPSLSAKKIKSLHKAGLYADGHNLYLRVGCNQKKSWVFRYMRLQKRHDMGLGSADVLSLAEARIQASVQRKLLLNNIDPIEYRRKAVSEQCQLESQRRLESVIFRDCAQQLIATKSAEWTNDKSLKQWESTLERYVYPHFGSRPLIDINQEHIVDCLRPIWNKKTETATRVRQRIEAVWDYGKAKGYCCGDNPAMWRGGLEFLLPNPSKIKKFSHHAALPYEQLPEFMTMLRKQPVLSARALELLILTACRTDEIRHATWGEFDLDRSLWVIPAERMKARTEHRVALGETAVSLLRSLPVLDNLVFPGSKVGKPLSNGAMSQLLKRMGFGHVTVHGFRSTFRDWVAEQTTFSGRLAEAALAHKLTNATEAAYQRRDMIEKRFEMMNAWADYCDSFNQVIKMRLAR